MLHFLALEPELLFKVGNPCKPVLKLRKELKLLEERALKRMNLTKRRQACVGKFQNSMDVIARFKGIITFGGMRAHMNKFEEA